MAELEIAHKELVLEYAEKATEVLKSGQKISESEHAERLEEIKKELNMNHISILSIAPEIILE